jgi:cell division septation protein DedD
MGASASQDVEISLGTGRLLGLFFALVVVCGIFFGLGYTLGRSLGPTAMTAEAATPVASAAKPKATSGAPAEAANPAPANDLTFYKTVEQKDANPQLTPPASAPAPAAAPTPPPSAPAPAAANATPYVVQVAAVSKKEDAEALVSALRKKNYPVFLASSAPGDSLMRVQVGPFNDIKEAEAMRNRLAGEGYSPIVKK